MPIILLFVVRLARAFHVCGARAVFKNPIPVRVASSSTDAVHFYHLQTSIRCILLSSVPFTQMYESLNYIL